MRLRPWCDRIWKSAVAWSWALQGLRLGSLFLVLPLLMRLPDSDYGFYFILQSLVALVPLLDLGFLSSIDRATSYAMGGAVELKAYGVGSAPGTGSPNFNLLWRLLRTTRWLYACLTLVVLVILGAYGTYVVSFRVQETSNPALTWLAWGITLAGGGYEVYSGWWTVYLRGLNQVLHGTRLLVLATLLKLALSCALLAGGAGLLSVPLAGVVSSALQRVLARRACLRFLAAQPEPETTRADILHLLGLLWPSSWRIGLQLLSGYLTTHANAAVCSKFLGLTANGQYGLTVQILTLCQAMGQVWVSVKWPLVFQHRARQETAAVRRLVWPRYWALCASYLGLAALAIACAPVLLQWFGAGKTALPRDWFALLAVLAFCELQFSFWGMLLLTENRSPFLWPTVATNALGITLTLILIQTTSLGVGALIAGPLAAGLLFNYWFWALAGARSLGTSLWRFLLTRPDR